ncbi:MAG: exosortase/archaeosortase family protein [Phycisphaerales bacterium]
MTLPRALSRQGWSWWHGAGAVLACGLGVLATFPAWADIYGIAVVDEESSHIFLVPIVAAWMVSVRRVRLLHCPPGGFIVGPALVALGWVLWSLGYRHAIQSFWHGGAVLIVVGCVLTVLGKHVLFRFLPAFVVLAFLVPVPGTVRQEVSLPMQRWGAAAAQVVLETLGFEVEREGNLLSINGLEVAIAEACNGMRMVFALVLVAYTFAYGMPLRNSVRLLVLLGSPLAAIGCNIVRLSVTVLLYGYADKPFADWFHDASGWLMLPVAFLMLMLVIKALRWALIPVARFTLAYQ